MVTPSKVLIAGQWHNVTEGQPTLYFKQISSQLSTNMFSLHFHRSPTMKKFLLIKIIDPDVRLLLRNHYKVHNQLWACGILLLLQITKVEIPFKSIMMCYKSQPLACKSVSSFLDYSCHLCSMQLECMQSCYLRPRDKTVWLIHRPEVSALSSLKLTLYCQIDRLSVINTLNVYFGFLFLGVMAILVQ